jgi:hypothetical protein
MDIDGQEGTSEGFALNRRINLDKILSWQNFRFAQARLLRPAGLIWLACFCSFKMFRPDLISVFAHGFNSFFPLALSH